MESNGIGSPADAADPAGAPPRPPRLRTWLGRAAGAFLVVVSIVFLFRTVGHGGWTQVGARLLTASPVWLGIAFLTNLGYYLAWGLRWRSLLRPVLRAPWWPAQEALMASIFVNTVVPFARGFGGLVRSIQLGRRLRFSIGAIYGVTLLDQIGYSAVSLALGMATVPAIFGARWPVVVLCLAGAALLAAAAPLIRRRRAGLASWVRRRIPAQAGSVEDGVRAAKAVLARPASYPIAAAGGAALWTLNVLTFMAVACALGARVHFAAAAAAWSLGSLAGVASGTPGGVGTTESVATVPLLAAGLTGPEAVALVVLARGIHYLCAVVIGGACLARGLGGWAGRASDLKPGADRAAG